MVPKTPEGLQLRSMESMRSQCSAPARSGYYENLNRDWSQYARAGPFHPTTPTEEVGTEYGSKDRQERGGDSGRMEENLHGIYGAQEGAWARSGFVSAAAGWRSESYEPSLAGRETRGVYILRTSSSNLLEPNP